MTTEKASRRRQSSLPGGCDRLSQWAALVLCWSLLAAAGLGAAAQKSPQQQQPQPSSADSAAAAAAMQQQQLLQQPPRQQVVKCPPCEQMHCVPRQARKLRCRGGVTTGICGCCPECARVESESCGGEWNYLGKCDGGLYCEPQQATVHSALLLLVQKPRDPVPTVGLPAGRCKKIPDQMMDGDAGGYAVGQPPKESKQPTATPCEPRCTPDFCERNPKAICSAIDVVDIKKDCQGKCQHTSCQACYWVEPEPDCGSCPRDDFDCIRKFARCVRKRQCTRDKFPCRPRKPGEGLPLGKFQCEVPRCHGR